MTDVSREQAEKKAEAVTPKPSEPTPHFKPVPVETAAVQVTRNAALFKRPKGRETR